ncbi:Processive diacylglycerol beta-glucosyltransferase [Sporomusa rhizae]|uniref:MGDG synthase family glycosyltransferase n=1 Tax=Sporomusa rhizae TaxID=357999 RepID=UPI00352A3B82
MAKKILFITAPIGAGHIKAAQAVSQTVTASHPDLQTEICNVFDFFHPIIGNTILKTYLKILGIFPQAYGAMYSWGNQSELALYGREIVSRFLARRMVNYIDSFQPSVIVCTHATPAGLVAWSKRKGLLSVPAAAIITDFVIHRLWVYPEMDRYFVSHENMVEYLNGYGIARKSVTITGIPVGTSFSRPCDRVEVLKSLTLHQDRKTILIMGGGAGILPMDEILEMCDQLDKPLQFIAIAGKNKQLYNKLSKFESNSKHPIKVLGYVDNVNEIMSAADILISKPGGMSTSEALALGLPLIIYRPIPGQEEANTRYLLDNKAALRADSLPELMAVMRNLLFADNDELVNLQQQAVRIGRPNAANDIAEFLVKAYFY